MLGKLLKVRIERRLLLRLIDIADDHAGWCMEECVELRESEHPNAGTYERRAAKARRAADDARAILGSGL